MTHALFSAKQIHEIAPLGSLIRFSDGTTEPPARHRRKHAAWQANNATGRLVRKVPASHISPPSFTLHLGDFGSKTITVVKAYRVFTVYDELSYAILDRPRPDQVAVLEDESGIPTLIHLSETEADAMTWLEAHPHPKARIAPKLGTLTYLQDPDRGWLIVTRAALKAAGMSPTDFSCSSHVLEHLFALEEDADMPKFLKRLDARGIAYRLQEHHVKGDAYCRYWDLNTRPLAAAG